MNPRLAEEWPDLLEAYPEIVYLESLKREGMGLIEVHTHPVSRGRVSFSPFDDEQLPSFARYVRNKLPGTTFGAIVLGPDGYEGHYWDGRKTGDLNLYPIGEARAVPNPQRPLPCLRR